MRLSFLFLLIKTDQIWQSRFGYFPKRKTTNNTHNLVQGLWYKAQICRTDKLAKLYKDLLSDCHTSSISAARRSIIVNAAYCPQSFNRDLTTVLIWWHFVRLCLPRCVFVFLSQLREMETPKRDVPSPWKSLRKCTHSLLCHLQPTACSSCSNNR